jgi:hypothetical protein
MVLLSLGLTLGSTIMDIMNSRPQPCRVTVPSGETFIAACTRAPRLGSDGYEVIAYREQLPQHMIDRMDKLQPNFKQIRLYVPAEQVEILSPRPRHLL